MNDEGVVTVAAPDEESRNKAMQMIKDLTAKAELNKIYNGKVMKISIFVKKCLRCEGTKYFLLYPQNEFHFEYPNSIATLSYEIPTANDISGISDNFQ